VKSNFTLAVEIMRKYQLTENMSKLVDQAAYERWLHRKASAHIKRDRARGNNTATNVEYKLAIHQAVCDSNGKDAYTDEELDWSLLSKYDNKQSKEHGRHYKKQFSLLPSVDHVGDGKGKADFKICSWRTNDSKNDMSLEEFIDLCKKVVAYNR
jgi:hypothetical protein